jgi:hypothetical protein
VTCSVGADWQTATSRGVVWGDSHAEHLLPLFDVAGRKTGRAVALFGDCPVIYYEGGLKRAVAGFANYDLGCAEKRARYLDLLKSSPELEFIFVAARWSAYLGDTYRSDGEPRSVAHGLKLLREGVEEFIGEMAPLHRKIILLGEMPQLGFDPIPCVMLERIYAEDLNLLRYAGERDRCHAATAAISRSSFEARQSATNAVLQSVAAGHPDVLAFFPTDAMCRPDCVTSVSGEFLFRDGNHLRRNLSAAALDELVLLLRLPELFARLGDGPAPRAMRKNN